ncbi:thiol reductant ABC exporter subunit CydC [Oceanobacillus massiliensis]|uniref:thiol reductant ABC exporter subunit CydC n=1 Tax=Oceanobacillus massiliensis TaxID=1465765 RepID=UPI00028903C7|nr:thiol reductant ABC exporter subunit CydC [Oceanobacillus massiliensis]
MKGLGTVIKVLLKEKKDIILSIICGFIAGIAAVGLFSSSGYLISKAALAPPIYTLMVLVAIVKLLGIVSALSRYGERYFSHRGTFTMLGNLRVNFYERLEPLAPAIFQRYRSGDLLARIIGDVETLQNYFLRVFYPPIVIVLVFLVTIFMTAFFSIQAAMIILLGLLLTTFIIPAFFGLRQQKVDRMVRDSRGKLSTDVTEFLYGFRELKIYQQLSKKEAELSDSANHYMDEQEKERIHNLFSESVNTFASLLVSVIVLAAGSYLVTIGQLDGIFLAMLVMISLTVFENTTAMAVYPSHLQDSRQAAARLAAVVSKQHQAVPLETGMEALQVEAAPSIRMSEVSFSYPGGSRDTVTNLSFSLPAGSKTAIVGPSGSGKSTIMQLLLKFYPAESGDISFSGQSIAGVSQECIWQNSNVILQSNHFFYGTIRENLALAKEGIHDGEMEEVLLKVQLDHFNLDSPVLEKGENLSGGEKQRLAMARVLLKKAPLWLLDEPTSSIDAITERELYNQLFEAAKDDTLVLVSHRLTGLERMDQIIVMERGMVIETGTYEELMHKRGYFYRMKEIEQSVFRGE